MTAVAVIAVVVVAGCCVARHVTRRFAVTVETFPHPPIALAGDDECDVLLRKINEEEAVRRLAEARARSERAHPSMYQGDET